MSICLYRGLKKCFPSIKGIKGDIVDISRTPRTKVIEYRCQKEQGPAANNSLLDIEEQDLFYHYELIEIYGNSLPL